MIVGLNPGPDLRSMEAWHSSSKGVSDVHGCHAAQPRVRVVEWVGECLGECVGECLGECG